MTRITETYLAVSFKAFARTRSTQLQCRFIIAHSRATWSGADPGEVKWVNFHPPPPPPLFSEPPCFFADAQTSNTSTRRWFYYIITKIHPPLQNPGSAPDDVQPLGRLPESRIYSVTTWVCHFLVVRDQMSLSPNLNVPYSTAWNSSGNFPA